MNFAALHTGVLIFLFSVSWLDHRGVTMSFFQSHRIDLTLSHCGIAEIAACGSNLSSTSNVTCTGLSTNGIISIEGMTIRGDATTSCKITCISRNYSSTIYDSFSIEIRAANLRVNLNSFPSRLYLGSPFSVSCAR